MKKFKKDDTTTINREALKKILKVRKKRQIDVAEFLKINIDYFRRCLQYGEIKEYYLELIAEYLDVHPELLQSDFIIKNDLTDKGIDLEGDFLFEYDFKSYQTEKFDFYELVNTIIYLTTGYKITGEDPVFTKQQYEEIITNMLDRLFQTVHTFKSGHPKFKIPPELYIGNYKFNHFLKNEDYFREPTIEELEEEFNKIKELKEQRTKLKNMVISAKQKGIDISTVEKEFKKLENEVNYLEKTEKTLKKNKNNPLTKRKRDI